MVVGVVVGVRPEIGAMLLRLSFDWLKINDLGGLTGIEFFATIQVIAGVNFVDVRGSAT